MIKRIQIENFKSFGKVDLEPHPKVNLLIGPNSSGKSNFLEALQFGDYERGEFESVHKILWSKIGKGNNLNPLRICLNIKINEIPKTRSEFVLTLFDKVEVVVTRDKLEFYFEETDQQQRVGKEFLKWSNGKLSSNPRSELGGIGLKFTVQEFLKDSIRIFRPNTIPLKQDYILKKFDYLSRDLNELPVLINSLLNDYPESYSRICSDLFEFTKEFKLIRAPSSGKDGFITINFFDDKMTRYSVNEVSEGILLFTAILAILHQPNPPKVILLEEPENGIHPRRLADIIGLIWKLAEEKDVQFFITTHSPIILDQFADSPESVLIFDKEEGISKVKKLSELLTEKAEFAKNHNLPQLDYTAELSENWLWGLLNGVPHVTSA